MNRCTLFFLFVITTTITLAQPELKFTRYTNQHGLVNNDVLCIYQDHFGFIWFGTKNGCSRFDGIEFKNYQYDENNPGTIKPGWVNQIVSDNQNRLWFAISGGSLMRYDYETESFIDISPSIIKQLNLKNKLFDIWRIYPDGEGNIWTEDPDYGFICYKSGNDTIEVFDHKNITQKNPTSYNFSKNDLWLLSWSGVFVHNKETNSFINYTHDPNDPLSLSSDKCNKILCDSKGDIWIATDNGLNKVALLSSGIVIFKHFKHNPENQFSLSNNLVYDIAEDNNGNLFIATVNGLCLMDRNTNKIYRYFNSEIDDESINSNLIRSIYKDNQGNIWFATNAGVGKLQIKNFKSYSQSLYKTSISHNKVQDFCELPNSDVWIATPRGIDVFDRKHEKFNFTIGITQNEEGLYGAPLVLQPDEDKGIWIGTWNGGLSYVKHAANKITNYITKPEAREMISIFFVFTDSKDNLWFSVEGQGLYVYNKKKEEYKKFSYNSEKENTLSSNHVLFITEDSEANIWIGTLNGLNLLIDFENEAFKSYLNETAIRYIHEKPGKSLWIATDNGLYNFNKSLQQFKKYNVDNGLPGNSIFGILKDSLNNLWISTNKGVVKLKTHGDSIKKVTVYHREDGIEVGEFIERSCIKLSDGTMMYGGTEGFCMFHPSEVKNDTLSPKVVFTDLKVANEIVNIGQEINGQVILKESITTAKQLTLNHKNNAFSIQFAGLQYNMPQYNQYCYRLEGYDPENAKWHYASSNDRYAEYMNLPRGTYILKVKSANSYGFWNNQPAEMKITILPPWWRTIWFISSMVILLMLLIVLVVRIRTRNLQKQKQKLEKIVERRTIELREMNVILNERKEELEAQAEELSNINSKLLKTNSKLEIKTNEVENMAKQLHEADQLKLQFFANISHEFRTPLSLIIAPLEKLLNLKQPILWNKINVSDYHHLMFKNAKRLLRLINQVIDFRKIESKEKRLNLSNNNIVEFTKEVIDAFSAQAEQKNISINLETQYPTFEFWFDSDVIEKILYNLISNAIKYTPEGGDVSIQLVVNSEQSTVNSNQSYDSPLNTDNCLLITVKDTGIGIKEENLNKIFGRFYRVENKENYAEGTGIGLAYTKELVELHQGIMLVESKYGKGTIFTLQFPFNKKALSDKFVNKDASSVHLDYIHSMIDLNEDKTGISSNEKYFNEDIESQLQEKSNILIVEDNADLRKFVKNELLLHFNVNEAENGKEGLELAVKIEPDLIISDIMMPVMDGIELCKRIKSDENTSHIPFILLTAKGSDNDQIKGLETGADDYITKPFNINILKIKIRNILLSRKHMQEKFNNTLDIIPSEVSYSVIDQQFLQKAVEITNKNMQNPEFDNDVFVSAMNCSRALVYKKIKSLTGQSVSDFIRNIRIKAAAKLFLEGNNNITEVCYKIGFKHPKHFAKYFSQVFGKPPREFIKDTLKE